jgi:hypothetical protein
MRGRYVRNVSTSVEIGRRIEGKVAVIPDNRYDSVFSPQVAATSFIPSPSKSETAIIACF